MASPEIRSGARIQFRRNTPEIALRVDALKRAFLFALSPILLRTGLIRPARKYLAPSNFQP